MKHKRACCDNLHMTENVFNISPSSTSTGMDSFGTRHHPPSMAAVSRLLKTVLSPRVISRFLKAVAESKEGS
jgi:hypothetical protein